MLIWRSQGTVKNTYSSVLFVHWFKMKGKTDKQTVYSKCSQYYLQQFMENFTLRGNGGQIVVHKPLITLENGGILLKNDSLLHHGKKKNHTSK